MQNTAKRQLSVRLSVFFAGLCTVFLLIGGAAEAEGPPSRVIEHVVGAGESLWSIASAHAEPGEDVRHLIADIRDVSGIANSTLHPGQIVLIPRA